MNATKARIVLVEDDLRLAGLVQRYLQDAGYGVSVARRGDLAVERVLLEDPDLVILDIGLPGKDGFSICRELRTRHHKPILVLTARSSDVDQVLALDLGADDYAIKPIEPRVLLARIGALLRRAPQSSTVPSLVLQFGGLRIEGAARRVILDGAEVPLSSSEFDLLHLLARNAGKVLSRDLLFHDLYRRNYDGLDRLLDVRISSLRRKLGDTGRDGRIRTVWGQGYLFALADW